MTITTVNHIIEVPANNISKIERINGGPKSITFEFEPFEITNGSVIGIQELYSAIERFYEANKHKLAK